MTKVIIWKKDRAEYILNGVGKYFKINRHELLRKHKTIEGINRKRIAFKLLKDVADLSVVEICTVTNHKGWKNIYDHYNTLTEDIDASTYGNKELKKTYLEVLDYLKL